MALDGETNLKMKRPLVQLAGACHSPAAISECRARFTVEDPNIDLYNFDGKLRIGAETVPLTNNEIIYRGSVLRNTQTAAGLVIFTGEECKIRMNATKNPRIKAPTLQAVVNRVVIIIVLVVLALAIFNSAAYEVWQRTTEAKSWYLNYARVAFGPIFTSFIIMFNTMIPLSLYVSLEIVKLCQMFLMNDVDMYDEDSNTPMEARTSTINEELGQVSYIFSDKTGTLTDNSMRFRKMSVAGTAWLHDQDLQEEAQHSSGKVKLFHKKRNNKGKGAAPRKSNLSLREPNRTSTMNTVNTSENALDVGRPSGVSTTWKPSNRPSNAIYAGRSEEMLEYIRRKPHTIFARKARLFILSMALCHTCIPEKDEEGNVTFQAASPDELALVNAAQDLGYVVVNRQSGSTTIKVYLSGASDEPSYETFEILDVIEFSSARKRMSVLVRMPDRRICIFSKGADSTITGLLRLSDLASTFVAGIERRNSERKSLEAQEVLRRRISQTTTSARKSLSFARTSVGAATKTSTALGRSHSIRDSVDHWLKDRETDVDMRNPRNSAQYYSPRLSQQPFSTDLSAKRISVVSGDERLSSPIDDDEDLVDEALVANEKLVVERCFQHINDFATEGLRTLMYGYRQISEEEYTTWKQVYSNAATSLVDRQTLIEKAADRIECQLELVGATAIEDKLQKGVPDTIDRLRRAGIKLWMLTGDKRETAINIGHSCRLVKDYSTVVVLDHEKGDVDQRMTKALADIQGGQVAHTVIVIDGQTLALIEVEQLVKKLFLELAICADSVICCRASPSQKASLVKAIRTKVNGSVTLAIGDGANDIAMIQEAHLGIGITGKEGLQAARSSDYSIAQFRFLLKLLLVHGRWNYIRVCKYTLGTFWKEMLFYLTQASYQRYNGYTGTSLYEPWSLSMFNTLFTSLPVIFMGIFEKDLAAATLLAAPELYSYGQRNGGFSIKIYLWWAFLAACEAVLIFNVVHAIYGNALFTTDNGLYATGALTFTCCITVISLKLQVLELHNKSIAAVIAIVLSVGGWYLWNILLAIIYSNNVIYNVKDGLFQRFGRNLLWWLTLVVVVVLFAVFEMTISTVRSSIFPTDVDVFQGYEQEREARKRFEEAAADYLQAGWDRGTKKSSLELAREAAMEAEREQHIEDLLKRPRTMTNERADRSQMRKRTSWPVEENVEMAMIRSGRTTEAAPKKSFDAAELFSRGFGSVKRGPDLR
jgi:phospholipid-translocating ATPase